MPSQHLTNTSKVNADWKARERLVAILEKSLSPDATVQHDVRLPVLGQSRSRQCDVVIRFGVAPRDSLAIVEVQKRNRRPDITTFHGWVAKMREVGAQQLICVSTLGYPKSIIEEVATRIGPTVKLLKLDDISECASTSPFTLMPTLLETAPKFSIKKLGPMSLKGLGEGSEVQLRSDEPVFRVGTEMRLISLNELITGALNGTNELVLPPPHQLANWSQPVEWRIDDSHQVKYHYSGNFYHVEKFEISILVTCDIHQIPISVEGLRYTQELIDGQLAWLTRTTIQRPNGQFEITIVVTPNKDGFLRNLSIFNHSV